MLSLLVALTSQITTDNSEPTTGFDDIVETFNYFISTLQNVWYIVGMVVAIVLIVLSVFSIRKRAAKNTENQISSLKRNGKYIPGLFVEMNESKDVLRFFLFGKKWKRRIVDKYNFVYDNFYGSILKKGNTESGVKFHLSRWERLDVIENAIDSALNYHERFSRREVKLKEEYQASEILFEIIHYPFRDILEELQHFVKAANCNYLVLTGSAGNGKTNLLCSIAELAIKLRKPVMLINARDISGNIDDYIFDNLRIYGFWKNHKALYYRFINATLFLKRQHMYILLDAVNENDDAEFGDRLCKFINDKSRYQRTKIIVSCRSEYYQERFSSNLSDNIQQKHLVYGLKNGRYPGAAVERIIKRYREHFKYSGYISDAVIHVLCDHLLLLRIFFEVYQGSKTDVLSIRKYEVFAEYINQIKKSKAANIETILNVVADNMIDSMSFDSVDIDVLSGFANEEIQKAMDETVLLNKKIVSHAGNIASQESESVYFVFDEMRDYYIARRIMQRNTPGDTVNGDGIISYLIKIKEAQVSCEEGVLQYAYVFFKTEPLLSSEEQKYYCEKILEAYRMEEGHKFHRLHARHREEFLNYGIKILFSTGLTLEKFEIDYIKDCLRKCPYEDGGKLFDTALEGTLVGLSTNLDLYFDILYGLHDYNQIVKAFKPMIADVFNGSKSLPYELIDYHKSVCEEHPDRAKQIQKAAELYMLFFVIEERDEEEFEMKYYFESLSDHEAVREEMISNIKTAINEEEKYE